MATTKNIIMKQFNGTDYDTLYPKTKVEQVENLTPSSIGAVAKSGDTMTGNLTIQNASYPDINLKNTGSGSATKIRNSAHRTQIMSQEDDNNYRMLTLNDKFVTTDVGNILQIQQIDGGVQTAVYKVLHTGNLSSLGIAKIATGSYVGTGTFGVNNPCSLTFPFFPKILIFFERHRLANNDGPFDMLTPSLSSISNYGVPRIWLANTNYQITHSLRSTYGDDGVYVQVSWGVTTQWYAIGQSAEADAMTQLNTSGQTYDYCAIG